MQAVKGRGTRLEKRLWSMLAGMGLRGWQKNVETITGKPDVVFKKQRVAIFVDGCFWHGCPHCKKKLPENNYQYWERKINRNIHLAQEYDEILLSEGWRVIRIWEHEMADTKSIRNVIRKALIDME